MKKDSFCLVFVCLLAIALAVPSVSASAGRSDTVRVALSYDPGTMNMLEMKTAIDIPPIVAMHEALLYAHPKTGDRVLGLAESIEVMSNPKDIKIKIYNDATFHTGDPVTAHDVKWTYEQCVNPQNANMMAGPLDEIESIEILDDYTLILHFWEPYAAWRELMWIGICSKQYYDKVGREEFRKHPVGSSLLRFAERKVAESITLEVDPNYKRYKRLKENFGIDPPNFRYLQFVVVPDEVSRIAMLETGELDIVDGILPHQLKRLRRNKHVKIKRCDTAPSLIGLAASPYADPIMRDSNLGYAIRYGINRQEIVEKIFLGEGYPLYLYASRSELGYDPDIEYAFDLDKAREYLKKSSYTPGYPLMLTYTSSVPNSSLIAAALQKYLTDVGITVKLQKLEEGTAATYSRNKDPKIGALRLYTWAGGRDPSTRLLLSIVSTSPYCSDTNRPRKKELDALCYAQAHEIDKAKRLKLLGKIHAILDENALGVVLCGLNEIYATSDRIEYNWTPQEALLVNVHAIRMIK